MKRIEERSQYWDNIKGILILLTVFTHILYQLQDRFVIINVVVDFVYMFHMPAFVFVSGYFGKNEHSRSSYAIIRLVFLYLIFNSITGFFFGFKSVFEPMYSYWYLIALIVWRLTAHRLAKLRGINFLLFLFALFVGFYDSIDNTFAAARVISFYPFYMFGYKLTSKKNEKFIFINYSTRLILGIITLEGGIICSFLAYYYFMYSDKSLLMFGYSNPFDMFGRIALFIIATLAIYTIRYICINRKLLFLTMFGRNSLWIFLFHRPFTLWLSILIGEQSIYRIIVISFLSTFILCLLWGNDIAAKYLNRFADSGVKVLRGERLENFNFAKLISVFIAVCFGVLTVIKAYSEVKQYVSENSNGNIIYPIMSSEQKAEFDAAFRITFSGDLILLEDQIKRAYTDGEYDFSPVFEYAEKYITSADFAIGVFEGPMAGEDAGYTASNYDDDRELYLNFPDQFAEAVKNAGFDLVTTANNHVLDKGEEGALRTLDILDHVGLDHTGSYRNAAEKANNHVKLVERDGIRMAFLSYTYGSNYIENTELIDGELSYVTSIISGTNGNQFEKLKMEVEHDFREAKELDPDLIVVLPHIGTQFSNEPDVVQEVWFNIFKECGADIILGDHPHVVEPVLIEDFSGRRVFTAYCPGNFANLYREFQGDTSMLIDIYIDRTSKQVIGGGIVPLYTQSPVDGNYRALPIYEIVNNSELRKQLSTDDFARAENTQDIITKVVFGSSMDIYSITERYYFNEKGFLREGTGGLELTDEMKSGTLYRLLKKTDSVCFIGDSITEGTQNGGCPWYEPIEEYLEDKDIYNYSEGGITVLNMNKHVQEIPLANLYVIALGTNDVRYRDDRQCAMTAESFVGEINKLREALSEKNPAAEFVFIAPWYSTDGDPFCTLSFEQKKALNDEYTAALATYCKNNNFQFINANIYIQNTLSRNPESRFLLDHIHPNAGEGVIMYSKAVLLS